jgi:hypothetical protein
MAGVIYRVLVAFPVFIMTCRGESGMSVLLLLLLVEEEEEEEEGQQQKGVEKEEGGPGFRV